MINEKRTYRVDLRLNEKEKELFKNKAQNYKKLSSMIRDAVEQFDDRGTKMRIQALNDLSLQIRDFGTELSKLGGNINQMAKRANELIYMGELNQDYYEKIILPSIAKVEKMMHEIKQQQSKIFKKIIEGGIAK